jgi:L-ascorbate metabolism protein UlaG (beta-lactamase superfamily)
MLKRLLLVVTVAVLLGAGWLGYRLNARPDLAPYADRFLQPATDEPGALRVIHLGVSTLLFDDGETAILTDGFFSRPGLAKVLLGRVAPDLERIGRDLARTGIDDLAAVIALHSHYDHAMDSPEVAKRTGALLIGSESTANVGRGWGLPEDRIRVADGETRYRFGDFVVTLVPSKHFPHGMAMGEIEKPLTPPARATAYKEGGSYSVFIEHGGRTLLVQGSAGFVEGRLRGRRAEVVFLGIGGLGTQDEAYRRRYWNQVVKPLRPQRVIPIHWDDFTRPLDQLLVPMPYLTDDFDASMRFLIERGAAEDVEIKLIPAGLPLDPFRNAVPGDGHTAPRDTP